MQLGTTKSSCLAVKNSSELGEQGLSNHLLLRRCEKDHSWLPVGCLDPVLHAEVAQ